MQKTAYARGVLDNLMGYDRDGDMAEYAITSYTDRRVCKPFLLGLCVHEEFVNTTMDQGPCPSEACGESAEKFRAQYRADRAAVGDIPEFEREQRDVLEHFIVGVSRSIERSQRREEQAKGYRPETIDLEAHPEVLELTAQIEKAVKDAETAGEEGNVDESERLVAEAARLKLLKGETQRRLLSADGAAAGSAGAASGRVAGNAHLLRACRACGAMLSVKDSDERLAEHFGGRMHVGVVKVRARLDELRSGSGWRGGGGAVRSRAAGDSRLPARAAAATAASSGSSFSAGGVRTASRRDEDRG